MELGLRVVGSNIPREVNVWNVTRSCSGFFFFFASFFVSTNQLRKRK